RAFRELLTALHQPGRVGIVGGGLYPRTALILRRLLPTARLTVIDADERSLMRARQWISSEAATFVHARFAPADVSSDFDLIVFPLAFVGNRADIYAHPPAKAVIVHDWLWRKRGFSRIVSVLLCKRMNLVLR